LKKLDIDAKPMGQPLTENRGMAKQSGDKWFVYILRCSDGSLYTGITKDVRRRCERHNAGTASRYTRSRLPVAVVYQERKAGRSLALKREAAIKAMSRLEKESLIRQAG
jgi:predicted GIY-YIG superfamily endonuclease